MSPPKIKAPEGLVYDSGQKECRMDSKPECIATQPDSYVGISPKNLSDDAFRGFSSRPASLWQSDPKALALGLALGPLSAVACASTGGKEGFDGVPIDQIDPLGDAMTLNDLPIAGKVRQVDLGINLSSRSAVAWSVSEDIDVSNPDQRPFKTFSFIRDGESGGGQSLVSESETISSDLPLLIQRDTAVTVLGNGESIIAFYRTQGEDQESDLVAQRVESLGNPTGDLIEILPPALRLGTPRPRLISTSGTGGDEGGFMVIYQDENDLKMIEYGANDSEVNRGTVPSSTGIQIFDVSQNNNGQWALAEIVSGSEIRVRIFAGMEVQSTVSVQANHPIPVKPLVRVALQDNGKVMVAWNGNKGNEVDPNPILEGAFLDSDGTQIGDSIILRDVTQGSGNDPEEIFNSLSLATDQMGNFFLAFEENRNIILHAYQGSSQERVISNVSSTVLEESGPYWERLESLLNPRVRNQDVLLEVSPDGIINIVYTTTLSGDNPDTGETESLQRITRRNYEISYQ